MKGLTLIILLITTSFGYGQSDFSSFLKNVQSLSVPYSSQYDNEIKSKRKVLTLNDRVYLISKLSSTKPMKVNEIVSSPFGKWIAKTLKIAWTLKVWKK